MFGAGTVQWSWGLDANHDRGSAAADVRMQQATVNLFADMGAQPATLQPGLVAATASTDATAPTSTITAPAAGATVAPGTPVTISGTATDAGGGVVGGVEVSTDGGETWRRRRAAARGRYTLDAPARRPATRSAAAPSTTAATSRTPAPGVTVHVGSGNAVLPVQHLGPGGHARRRRRDDRDSAAVELGVKFRATVRGPHHRRALLQGRGEHRHARRPPVDAHAARCSRR